MYIQHNGVKKCVLMMCHLREVIVCYLHQLFRLNQHTSLDIESNNGYFNSLMHL